MEIDYEIIDVKLYENGILNVEFSYNYKNRIYKNSINFGGKNVLEDLWKIQLEDYIVHCCKSIDILDNKKNDIISNKGKKGKIVIE